MIKKLWKKAREKNETIEQDLTPLKDSMITHENKT
jgi:hypothetical protein